MPLRLVSAEPTERPSPSSWKIDHGPTVPPVDTLFRKYAPYVATIAMRLLGREDEVDDVVQDVFVAAIRGVGDVVDPEAIKGWLATVTVRAARRRLRFRRLRGWLWLEPALNYDDVPAPDAGPEERLLVARVYRALDHVPANCRIAWTLRHVEGQPLDRIAATCGCSLATTKRWIAAALAVVRASVGDE